MRARSAFRCNALFGGKCGTRCRSCASSRSRRRPRWPPHAQKLVDRGYRYLKIKVHGEVEEDVARVARHPPPGRRRRASHHRRQPILFAEGRDRGAQPHGGIRIDLAEQPVDADDFAGLGAGDPLRCRSPSKRTRRRARLREVFQLVSRRMVDAVSLKIPKLGGLRNTLAAARLCEAGHISIAWARRSAAGCCRRRRCISPARCRASIMPANWASSTVCSTIRSKASRLQTACRAAAGAGSGVRLIRKGKPMAKTA